MRRKLITICVLCFFLGIQTINAWAEEGNTERSGAGITFIEEAGEPDPEKPGEPVPGKEDPGESDGESPSETTGGNSSQGSSTSTAAKRSTGKGSGGVLPQTGEKPGIFLFQKIGAFLLISIFYAGRRKNQSVM